MEGTASVIHNKQKTSSNSQKRTEETRECKDFRTITSKRGAMRPDSAEEMIYWSLRFCVDAVRISSAPNCFIAGLYGCGALER